MKADHEASTPSSESGRTLIKGERLKLRLWDLKAQEANAKAAYEASRGQNLPAENIDTARIKFEVAKKRSELFKLERDSTGAWKEDGLGRDLAGDFFAARKNDKGDVEIERDEKGERVILEGDKRAHLVMVNMGELDRLNASGDHHLGDAGLARTFESIEAVAIQVLSSASEGRVRTKAELAKSFDIYRLAGNDFALNLREVSPEEAEEIRQRLNEAKVDMSADRPGEEPVPLAASGVSRAGALELLNELSREGLEPADAGLTDQKVMIDILLESTRTATDVEKLKKRAHRFIDVLLRTPDQSAAKNFYEKFLQKSLSSAFREPGDPDLVGFELAQQRFKEAGAFSQSQADRVKWTEELNRRAHDDAFAALRSRREVDRKINVSAARKIASTYLQRQEEFGIVVESEAEPISTNFIPPEKTRGKAELDALEAKMEKAKQQAGESDLNKARAEDAEMDYRLKAAERDRRTGLMGRGPLYRTMEAAHRADASSTAISLDMGFLKYFDKEGGPETGNKAIAKMAEILDVTAQEFSTPGVKVEAYRVGGDEFAITLVGEKLKGDKSDIAEKVVAKLRERARQAGRVPGQTGVSKSAYQAEALNINCGVFTVLSSSGFEAKLLAAGIPLEEPNDERHRGKENYLADMQFRMADKEMEITKAVDRISFLIKRRMDIEQGITDEGNYKALLEYSKKAIFGEAGQHEIERLVNLLKHPDEILASLSEEVRQHYVTGRILEFVVDQIEIQNSKKANYEATVDFAIEGAVRRDYYEKRVKNLEADVADLRLVVAKNTQEKTARDNRIRVLEEEIGVIGGLQSKIRASEKKAA